MDDCKVTMQECELQTILNRLVGELSKYDEYSNIILDKTSKISNYREPSPENCEKAKQREGFVGEFDNAILRLIDYNCKLEEIIKGLTKIVG